MVVFDGSTSVCAPIFEVYASVHAPNFETSVAASSKTLVTVYYSHPCDVLYGVTLI